MDIADKLELIGLAKNAMKTSLGENGITESMLQLIHPNAKSNEDLDLNDLSIIMYIEGYLRCKKENQNIIKPFQNLRWR